MDETQTIRELSVRPGLDPSRPAPPAVRDWPLVGASLDFLRDPQALLMRGYRAHGPVFSVRLGPHPFTVIAGPEGSSFMTREGKRYITAAGVWDNTARITGADPHAIMTNVEGDKHAALRGLFRAGMSKSAGVETMGRSLALAEAALADAARRSETVDAVAFARALVFEQLGHAMAGRAPTPMFDAADQVLTAIVRGVRVPALMRLPLRPRLKRAAREVASIAKGILESTEAPRPTFLENVREGLDTGLIRETDLPAIMLTPFIAGLDTMAHAFGFVLHRLTEHPTWAARLRDEVDGAAAARGHLDADAVMQCHELGYFVQEVLRIHPVSPAVIRTATEDFVLEGYQIRAGDKLLVAHTLAHFLDALFPEPHRFDPLRFAPERGEHRGASRFMPFGIGAHVCLGAGIAEVLLRANAAAFLRHVEIARADPAYRLRVSNLSGACPVGLELRIRPRPAQAELLERSLDARSDGGTGFRGRSVDDPTDRRQRA